MANGTPVDRSGPPSSASTSHAIVTAIGADRPGLVEELSRFIFDRGGNIEDSRMVNLRGQFAMMVLVAGPPDTLHKIRLELGPFAHHSRLHAELRPADEKPAGVKATAGANATETSAPPAQGPTASPPPHSTRPGWSTASLICCGRWG